MTLAFPGRGTQQDAKSPGGFWSVLGELLSTAASRANKGNAKNEIVGSRVPGPKESDEGK